MFCAERQSTLAPGRARASIGARQTSGLPLMEAFAIETRLTGVVAATQDAREGPRAFNEKRFPEF